MRKKINVFPLPLVWWCSDSRCPGFRRISGPRRRRRSAWGWAGTWASIPPVGCDWPGGCNIWRSGARGWVILGWGSTADCHRASQRSATRERFSEKSRGVIIVFYCSLRTNFISHINIYLERLERLDTLCYIDPKWFNIIISITWHRRTDTCKYLVGSLFFILDNFLVHFLLVCMWSKICFLFVCIKKTEIMQIPAIHNISWVTFCAQRSHMYWRYLCTHE